MVDDERPAAAARREAVLETQVRFRTLGCYPLTGAVESDAANVRRDRRRDADRPHLRARRAAPSTMTKRGSMEKKKREGYF